MDTKAHAKRAGQSVARVVPRAQVGLCFLHHPCWPFFPAASDRVVPAGAGDCQWIVVTVTMKDVGMVGLGSIPGRFMPMQLTAKVVSGRNGSHLITSEKS